MLVKVCPENLMSYRKEHTSRLHSSIRLLQTHHGMLSFMFATGVAFITRVSNNFTKPQQNHQTQLVMRSMEEIV